MKEIFRYIIGYIIGITIFLFLIPLGLYEITRLDYLIGNRVIINSTILRIIISLVIFFIGVWFMIWSNIFLFRQGKGGPAEGFGIAISPRTKKLVTTGPYRFSRNPMVFGAFSIYFSLMIFFNSIIGILFLIVSIFIGIIYLKLSEEKRLLKDFGNEYIEYKKKVSMIFPLKCLKK